MRANKKEKRVAPRVRERFPVKITSAGKTYRGESYDVSMSGLACSSPLPLPVSAPVTINLILPAAGPSDSAGEASCRGRVVRVECPANRKSHDGYRLAFNFSELSALSRRRLERFIEERLESDNFSSREILTRLDSIFRHGITCRTSVFIPPFHEVEVNILIDRTKSDSPSINCSGVVVNCEEDESGSGYLVDLYFLDMEAQDRRIMEDLIRV